MTLDNFKSNLQEISNCEMHFTKLALLAYLKFKLNRAFDFNRN